MIRPSKHYYFIGTNLMLGASYGTIRIIVDKTKTLAYVKQKIVEFLRQNHGVSTSENNFELYKTNTRPINPGSFSRNTYNDNQYNLYYATVSISQNKLKTNKDKPLIEVGNVLILKMKSAWDWSQV